MTKLSSINKILIFLFPIFFAMPDLAIPTGVINLRYDDLIIYLLFLINIKPILLSLNKIKPKIFYRIHYGLILYSIISFLMVFLLQKDYWISSYEAIRSFGSLPYFFVLPYLLNKKEYRKFFYYGAFIGGAIYIYFLILNYKNILQEGFVAKTSASLKKHISFSTLNPNAVATLATILGWVSILAFLEYKRKLFLILGVILLFIPVAVFARSMSLGIAVSILLFIIFQKQKGVKVYSLYIFITFIVVFLFFNFVNTNLLDTALNVDVSTGKGFSGRYELWGQGVELITQNPIFGYGFCTEHGVYVEKFDGHQSHQILLHYSIELGLVSMILFVFSIIYLLLNRLKLYKKSKNTLYLLQFSILSSFFIADMAGQLLYFNKYAFIIYAISSFYLTSTRSKDV